MRCPDPQDLTGVYVLLALLVGMVLGAALKQTR